jgi:hypothetical protein
MPYDQIAEIMTGIGLSGLFSNKKAEKNLEKYVNQPGKREEMHRNFMIDPVAELNAVLPKSGYTKTLGDSLSEKYGIDFQIVPKQPTFMRVDGDNVAYIDGMKIESVPGKEKVSAKALKNINKERRKNGLIARPGRDTYVNAMTNLPKTEDRIQIDAHPEDEESKRERIKEAVKGNLPSYNVRKNWLKREVVEPLCLNYENTLGSLVDAYGKDDVYKAVKELQKEVKSGDLPGVNPFKVQAAKRLIETNEHIHRKRNVALALGSAAIIGLSLGAGAYAASTNHPIVKNTKDKDSDNGGITDFHEINTYGTNPNNATDDHVILANLPHVTAKLWDPDKVGGFSTENYVAKSLTDPLIQYLAQRTEIKWNDNTNKSGFIFVDGSPVHNSGTSNTTKAAQPSYYFTQGVRTGDCVESTMADLAILKAMGFKAVHVGMKIPNSEKSHDASEVLIDGKVYVANYGGIILREDFYKNTGYVPKSGYDPDWHLK